MHPKLTQLDRLDTILSGLSVRVRAWEVHALLAGAVASPDLHVGPQHLLGAILGSDAVLDSVAQAKSLLGALMDRWNFVVREQEAGRGSLSAVPVSDPPTLAELKSLAEVRAAEVDWFISGIELGDDDADLGEEGEVVFEAMTEGAAIGLAYVETLEREAAGDERARKCASRDLARITRILEEQMLFLAEIGRDARRRTLGAERLTALSATPTNGGRDPHVGRVGRNEPCPCSSGRKWKKCCGAPTSTVVQ